MSVDSDKEQQGTNSLQLNESRSKRQSHNSNYQQIPRGDAHDLVTVSQT